MHEHWKKAVDYFKSKYFSSDEQAKTQYERASNGYIDAMDFIADYFKKIGEEGLAKQYEQKANLERRLRGIEDVK